MEHLLYAPTLETAIEASVIHFPAIFSTSIVPLQYGDCFYKSRVGIPEMVLKKSLQEEVL